MRKVPLHELMPTRVPSIDPANFPDEMFELWSIPSFDIRKPERLFGREIGSAKNMSNRMMSSFRGSFRTSSARGSWGRRMGLGKLPLASG
jgi:type I restriction enzyme S subunit